MNRKLAAEFFGTFWLVFGGCGSAVLAAGYPALGIGFAGVALAFGLTVLTMAYAVGGISGGHFKPAVSLGLAVAGRFNRADLLPYWVAQVLGGFAAAGVLYVIASGAPGFVAGGFASNGYGDLSPGKYGLLACLVAEVVLTAFFLIVILGSTAKGVPAGFAPIAIGLCLTLIHLVSSRSPTRRSIRRAPPPWRCLPAAAPWRSCGCSGWRRSPRRTWRLCLEDAARRRARGHARRSRAHRSLTAADEGERPACNGAGPLPRRPSFGIDGSDPRA
ncbi:Aquaporin Z 2 [Methylobrevis pamukkalensis]|uniref:Aquaporin Z 2 n=1 Tax=Methylobrevis pamukkalensis TaxID=1439726 RepID=A0A1E3GYG7_9HYPH|nr:Aquaporin Z 2 [Methylobrevis pamukkalensis]